MSTEHKCSDPECGHTQEQHYKTEELGPMKTGRHPCRRCYCWDFIPVGATRPEGQGYSIAVRDRDGVVTATWGRGPFRIDERAEVQSLEQFDRFAADHPHEYIIVQGSRSLLMEQIRQRETVEYVDSFSTEETKVLDNSISNLTSSNCQ